MVEPWLVPMPSGLEVVPRASPLCWYRQQARKEDARSEGKAEREVGGGPSGSWTSSSSQFRGAILVATLEGRTEAGVTPATPVGKMNELHTPVQRKEA